MPLFAPALPAWAASNPETVVVTGEQTLSLPLLTGPVAAKPQSITTIPDVVMQQQQVFDLRDILRNDPNVTIHANEDSGQGTNITIRGFSARYDTYLDGMQDAGSYFRDGFNLSEVDVLSGPSSVMFGRGSTGGVVNQVIKTAQPDGFYDGAVTGGTDGTVRVTGDINVPLSDTSALRVNALSYQGGVADRDVARYDRIGFAPTVSFGMGTDTRTTLSYFHQTDWDVPDYGVPWIDIGSSLSEPAHVQHSNFYGFSSDYTHNNVDVGTLTVAHDLAGGLTLRNQLRYGNYERDYRATDPVIDPVIAAGTPYADVPVTRTMRGGASTETTLDNQLDLTARFDVLGLSNTMVSGIEGQRQTASPIQLDYSGVPDANLAHPDPYQPFSGTASVKSDVHAAVETLAAYAVDTIKYGPWSFLAAARLDDYKGEYTNTVPNLQFLHDAVVMPSYKGAIVYSVTPSLNAYAAYGTSFDPSAEGLSLSGATAGLGPERSHSVETGMKWNATDGLLVSGALFRTIMSNMREPSPTDPTVDVLEGTAQAEGFELKALGRIMPGWSLLAGYTYLDGRVVHSPDADSGTTLQNAPRHNVRLWTVYDLPLGFEAGAGMNYQSSRVPASLPDANGYFQKVPGYWTGSAMLRHALTDHLSAQLNVANITDTYYYDGLDDDHVELGAGRTVMLTISANY